MTLLKWLVPTVTTVVLLLGTWAGAAILNNSHRITAQEVKFDAIQVAVTYRLDALDVKVDRIEDKIDWTNRSIERIMKRELSDLIFPLPSK